MASMRGKVLIAGMPTEIPAAVIVVHQGPEDAPDQVGRNWITHGNPIYT